MRHTITLWTKQALLFLFIILLGGIFLAHKEEPKHIQYGMSFNTLYARELGLNWREVYDAFLSELGVRHLRLAAHWDMVEPENNVFNFSELDYQLDRAHDYGAEVIFGVGRRLPRWPECHAPSWAGHLSPDERQPEILEYIEVVVNRYKDNPAITHWQVENEPYLEVFAKEHCGDLDEDFLQEEIDLVRELDPTRPILMTDSGNLGTWISPYRKSDVFGTSVYVYFWNPELGQFKTILPPYVYRMKENLVNLFFGEKEVMLIELSLEPWLLEPVVDVPTDIQYARMNLKKFDEIIEYAKETRFQKQYLWGGEWWYWLRQRGHPEMWERGKEVFRSVE